MAFSAGASVAFSAQNQTIHLHQRHSLEPGAPQACPSYPGRLAHRQALRGSARPSAHCIVKDCFLSITDSDVPISEFSAYGAKYSAAKFGAPFWDRLQEHPNESELQASLVNARA